MALAGDVLEVVDVGSVCEACAAEGVLFCTGLFDGWEHPTKTKEMATILRIYLVIVRFLFSPRIFRAES
jgi:hypothetical protein